MGERKRTVLAERETSASGHFEIGADRRIIEWDEAAARLLGISRQAALGRPCAEVLAGRSGFGRAVCGSSCPALKVLDAGNIAGTSAMFVHTIAGARARVACELTALPGGGALGRLRCAHDTAPDLAHELAGIAMLTARVSEKPLQQGLRLALDFLRHATVADAGEAFLAEPHGKGVIRTCHQGSFGGAFDQVLHFDPGEGFPGLVLSRGQPAYTNHLPQDARFLRTEVTRKGFNTYVCAPLASHGDALGCLALAFRRSDIDLERVLNLLRWVGTPMGMVVDTALAHLRDAAIVPLRGVENDPGHRLPEALRVLLQEMVRVSRADGGELCLPGFSPDLRVLAPRTGAVPPCPAVRAGAIGRCPTFETGTTRILHGQRKAWPLACRGVVHPGGAWCCIPMSCDGESLGIVRLLYRRLRPSPPNESLALIEGLASLAAEKLSDLREHLAPARRSEAAPCAKLERGAAVRGNAAVRGSVGETAPQRVRPTGIRETHDGARLKIRCLGALELSVDGTRVPPAAIQRKRVMTLLGILLTYHDQPQCKDALIEMLWPGADPAVRAKQFYVLVHELRKLVEPRGRAGAWLYVRSQVDRYAFDTQSSCWIDVLEFRALLELGRKADAAHEELAAINAYEAAAELYQGDYLQDEPLADWCWQTREQLREAFHAALNRLATLWGGQGRWNESAAWSRRALFLDPLREEMHRALMYALWASGRRGEAVRQYEACAHLLRERLDLAPLPETEQLFARIRTTARPHSG